MLRWIMTRKRRAMTKKTPKTRVQRGCKKIMKKIVEASTSSKVKRG